MSSARKLGDIIGGDDSREVREATPRDDGALSETFDGDSEGTSVGVEMARLMASAFKAGTVAGREAVFKRAIHAQLVKLAQQQMELAALRAKVHDVAGVESIRGSFDFAPSGPVEVSSPVTPKRASFDAWGEESGAAPPAEERQVLVKVKSVKIKSNQIAPVEFEDPKKTPRPSTPPSPDASL